jgi:5-methylcytosine-specific restriction endonuclease McrA
MSRLPVHCLGCGRPTRNGSRCPRCTSGHEAKRGTTAQRFGPGWQRISREVIQRDSGICHICGRPGADTADHLQPRNGQRQDRPADKAELAAAHRACNSAKGARMVGSRQA